MRYAETVPTPQEAQLARAVVEVCSSQLGIKEPTLEFIAESPIGDIVQEAPILGLASVTKIYILRGLSPRELVKTTAHEVKHIWQRSHGTYNLRARERSARIFEYEFTETLNGQTYDELFWGLLKRKSSSFRNDARPAYTKPKPPAPVVRDVTNKMFETVPERIQYIRNLLVRLPKTAVYQSQRASLAAELAERLAAQ